MTITFSPLQIRTSVGEWQVAATGVFHLDAGADAKLDIDDISLVLKFVEDDGLVRYEGTSETNTLTINLFNHKDPVGIGELSVMEIATLGENNEIVLGFSYFASKPTSRKGDGHRLEYVLYTKGAV